MSECVRIYDYVMSAGPEVRIAGIGLVNRSKLRRGVSVEGALHLEMNMEHGICAW